MDCIEGMKQYPDNYFELAIVDPPYGIGISNKSKITSSSKKEYKIKDWDNSIPTKEYFNELKRVSKNQIIWGVNYFDGFGLNGGRIIWNKLGKDIGRRNPMPNLSDCEIAYCSMRTNIKCFLTLRLVMFMEMITKLIGIKIEYIQHKNLLHYISGF